MSAIVPLVLALLSVTRRRTKVRMSHLLRHGVYGLAWMVPIALLAFIDEADTFIEVCFSQRTPGMVRVGWWSTSHVYGYLVEAHPWSWLVALAGWLAAWWWWSIVKVLRLPRSVWIACMIIALLAGTLVGLAQLFDRAFGSMLYSPEI